MHLQTPLKTLENEAELSLGLPEGEAVACHKMLFSPIIPILQLSLSIYYLPGA